jgi:hypothetical protein
MVTIEFLHGLVDALPEGEREAAARLLEGLAYASPPAVLSGADFFASRDAHSVLRPDAPPVADIAELRGQFWPEDEGPDDFTDAVRAWRREGSNG